MDRAISVPNLFSPQILTNLLPPPAGPTQNRRYGRSPLRFSEGYKPVNRKFSALIPSPLLGGRIPLNRETSAASARLILSEQLFRLAGSIFHRLTDDAFALI
jgi:hypothetical protein